MVERQLHTGALYNISNHENGLMCIFRTGGIPVLIRMLGSPIDAVVYYSITTLHNLIIYMDGAKQEVDRFFTLVKTTENAQVKMHRGVDAMIPLLTREHGKQETVERFQAILNDCLYLLALGDQTSKVIERNQSFVYARFFPSGHHLPDEWHT